MKRKVGREEKGKGKQVRKKGSKEGRIGEDAEERELKRREEVEERREEEEVR